MRKYVKTAGGFLLALIILTVLLQAAGPANIITAVTQADIGLLIIGGLLSILSIVVLGTAWTLIIRQVTDYRLLEGVRVFFATQFANGITPLGQFGGEPFIAYIVSRDSENAIEEVFGAVLAADLLNSTPFFTMSFIGLTAFLLYFPLGAWSSTILILLIVLVTALSIGVWILWRRRDITLRLAHAGGEMIGWLLNAFNRSENKINGEYAVQKGKRFYAVLEDVTAQKRTMAAAVVIAHAASLLGILGLYVILLSLGFEASLAALLFILPASMLAGYLPLPGGFGGIDAAMIILLTSVAQVPLAVASAATLLFRLSTYGLNLTIGGFFTSRLTFDSFKQR